mgnify:CR=1 FL=1
MAGVLLLIVCFWLHTEILRLFSVLGDTRRPHEFSGLADTSARPRPSKAAAQPFVYGVLSAQMPVEFYMLPSQLGLSRIT